jgi:DNA-binding SARP family transcriptional activator
MPILGPSAALEDSGRPTAAAEGLACVPANDTHRTALYLLNVFDLRRDGVSLHIAPPAQRLLAFLAIHERSAERQAVARILWSDSSDQQAAARLRSTLWRLPAPDGERLVRVDAGRLTLNHQIDVDLRIARDESRAGQLEVDALCSDVLSGWSDEWVVVERERFRQLRLRRLEQLSERARGDGRHAQALEAALAAVSVEPLRESAHRQAMLVHLAEHNPSEALRQFEFVRRLLRDELGLAPSPATRAVVADLLGRPLDLRAAR